MTDPVRLVRTAGFFCLITAVLNLAGMFPDFSGDGGLADSAAAWGFNGPYVVIAAVAGLWALAVADERPAPGALATICCGTAAFWFGLCGLAAYPKLGVGLGLQTVGNGAAVGAGVLGGIALRRAERPREARRLPAWAVPAALAAAVIGFTLNPFGGVGNEGLKVVDLGTSTGRIAIAYLISLVALAFVLPRTGEPDAPLALLMACGWLLGRAAQGAIIAIQYNGAFGPGVWLTGTGLLALAGVAVFERSR
jgi:hypothetical protein